MKRNLLCLSYRFPPETYPLAIRVRYFLEHLQQSWEIDAVTAAEGARAEGVRVHHVPARQTPTRLLQVLRRLRMDKLSDLLAWPDPFVFWLAPALAEAKRLVEAKRPDALLVFMMPYSTGLAGVLLKKMTGLPLVLNLNDSPTCSDMAPSHPSWMHYRMTQWLEDLYVRTADAVVYVSENNMKRVRARQPEAHRNKFHLIRRGVDLSLPPTDGSPTGSNAFRIVFTGGMSGWHQFLDGAPSLPKRLYRKWQRLGRHRLTQLDHRSHSPVYVGRAVKQVLRSNPAWKGRVQVEVYGVDFPRNVIDEVLNQEGVADVVSVQGSVPHAEALRHMHGADLLFLTLPDRPDGSPGGRISAKTYEYLATDRPLLAAVPPGENRDYLEDKPGTHLVEPKDVGGMASVIERLAAARFAGEDLRVDRSALRPTLSSSARAEAFAQILDEVAPAEAN